MRRRAPREIDLGRADIGPADEVLELAPDARPPDPPPLRLFAGLPEPAEAPYVRGGDDPTGTASLWRAIASL
jgi:hypothetical protein